MFTQNFPDSKDREDVLQRIVNLDDDVLWPVCFELVMKSLAATADAAENSKFEAANIITGPTVHVEGGEGNIQLPIVDKNTQHQHLKQLICDHVWTALAATADINHLGEVIESLFGSLQHGWVFATWW